MNPGIFFCTQILPAIGSQSSAQHKEWYQKDHGHFPGSRVGYNDMIAKGVDAGLQRQRAQGDKRDHKAHGQAGGNQVTAETAVGQQMLQGNSDLRIFPAHIGKAKERRQGLGDDCGDGSSGHTVAQTVYEQIIQADIQQIGNDEKHQRGKGVPDGAQHSRTDIV